MVRVRVTGIAIEGSNAVYARYTPMKEAMTALGTFTLVG